MLRAPVSSYFFPILYQVQQAVDAIKNWVWTFVSSVFSNNGALSELKSFFVIGIAVSVLFLAIFIIKKVVWGR